MRNNEISKIKHSQQWLDDSIYEIQKGGGTIWKHWIVMWVPEGKRILDKDLMDTGMVKIVYP